MSNLNFYPPTIYFNDINFNNDFYAIPNNNQGISLAYANAHFLFSTGVANSTATSTFFSGSVGVGAIATGLSGDMNALTYLLNGNNISNIFVSSNVLSNTSNALNTKIDTKENILSFNTPFNRVNNTLSLLYDTSLNIDGTGKLSVASGNSSKWTTSGTNIFNNNTGNVGVGSQIPAYKLDVSGDVNAIRYLLNGNNISNIFVASNVLNTTSNTLSNLTFNSSNINSNFVFNSSNSNFNYTSNSLFSNLNPIYASSNAVKDIIIFDTPQVNKKSAFYCMTNNIIYINGGSVPYYAYHIDLRNYTKTGYIDIGSGSGDTYRIFTIKAFFGSSYFQKLVNGIPDICEYTIYMSNKANSGGYGTIAGLNIQAIGIPNNPYLNSSVNNNLFILRNSNGNFNYISIVTTSPADCRIFIEDLLN